MFCFLKRRNRVITDGVKPFLETLKKFLLYLFYHDIVIRFSGEFVSQGGMFCVPLTPALSLKGRGSYRLASDLIRGEGEKTLDSCFRRNDGFGVLMPIFIPMMGLGSRVPEWANA